MVSCASFVFDILHSSTLTRLFLGILCCRNVLSFFPAYHHEDVSVFMLFAASRLVMASLTPS